MKGKVYFFSIQAQGMKCRMYSPLVWALISGVLFVLLITRCTRIEGLLQNQSPRESYLEAIENTPLSDNQLWQRWGKVGDSAVKTSVSVELPFQQKINYFPDVPISWAWKIDVRAGRKLEFNCLPADTSHQLFLDLFEVEEGEIRYIKSAVGASLVYEVKEDGVLVVRLQPELLIGGQATFRITDYPTLGFPVEGAIPSDIGSFWGDPRDGGDRMHEGVDIFAPRGTPVIAVSSGRVNRIGNGGLGGKTVWVRTKNHALYYAHLDSITVEYGTFVGYGDTLGFVGNTGNARTTPPHLHFGIYRRGAVNPLPFIEPPETRLQAVEVELQPDTRWGRISASLANVRPIPSTNLPPITSLRKNQIVGIRGATAGWFDVLLPGDTLGYIHHSLVTTALTPLNHIVVQEASSLLYPWPFSQITFQVESESNLDNYGFFDSLTLTRYQNHWVFTELSPED